ncbi:hypothetical protein [Terasakiella pusilla]|uniref:hypothetical protein n=1 Tax=Terasakiella pusilla TaxID=64973 RepID=UPI003AA95C5F
MNALTQISHTQIDNIYSGQHGNFVLAAISIDRKSLIFFDGLGWCADAGIAKKFVSIGKAAAEADREPPTHHPLEIWKLVAGGVKLSNPGDRRRSDLPEFIAS